MVRHHAYGKHKRNYAQRKSKHGGPAGYGALRAAHAPR